MGPPSAFLSSSSKNKKNILKKFLIFSQKVFLIFQEMELFSPNIKKFLIFFQKESFLIFRKIEHCSP